MISQASGEPVANHRQIAYTLDSRTQPRVVIVEFLCHAIADPEHAAELSHELGALVRPDLPIRYVLDFEGVRSLSSTAFGALLSFILRVRHAGGFVAICNMDEFVRFGADTIRIGDFALFAADRPWPSPQSSRNRLSRTEPVSSRRRAGATAIVLRPGSRETSLTWRRGSCPDSSARTRQQTLTENDRLRCPRPVR